MPNLTIQSSCKCDLDGVVLTIIVIYQDVIPFPQSAYILDDEHRLVKQLNRQITIANQQQKS